MIRHCAATGTDDKASSAGLRYRRRLAALIDDCAENLQLLPQGFVFSLPALHSFFDPDKSIEYRDFRKLLYDSTLNQELSAFDAEVALFKSTGKVDTSLYCLRHIPGV